MPLDKLGQFTSTDAYLVEFKFQHWQTVFLWVGSHISYELNDNSVLIAAVDLCKKMSTRPELVSIYYRLAYVGCVSLSIMLVSQVKCIVSSITKQSYIESKIT